MTGVNPPMASIDLAVVGPEHTLRAPTLSGAESLHKNLATFPGQVMMTPPRLSAAQEGKISRRDAVRAARHAERTSEHIRGGIDRKVDMVVGATLRVHAQPDWDLLGISDWKTKKPFAQACEREFRNWGYGSRNLCDAEGHYNFGGLMWLAFRNLTGPDAETAGVIHYDEQRAASYNHRWATFVTVLDPDRIETPGEFATDEAVHEGKRLDEHGRMIGLYVKDRHPAEGTASDSAGRNWRYVPRETWWGRAMCFHFFVKTRGGQQRGVTNLATILKQTGMVDQLDDAMIGAAILQNVLATYIETLASPETVAEQLAPAGDSGKSLFDYKLDYYEQAKVRIGGQRIPTMPPGDKIVMEAIARSIGDPTAFRNNFLRQFASSVGVSFEQLSQNFSEANYSAARAALLEVWRGVLTLRKLFTAHVASLIYAAVIEEAVAKGRVKLPPGAPPFQENRDAYTACAWTGPGMGWIDPQKEANAIQTMLAIKLKSRATAAAEMDGSDYLETFDQIEQEIMEAEERGFTLDPPMPGQAGADPDSGDEDPDEPKPKPKPKPAVGSQED